jgi:hypothetical protein
VSRVRVDVPGGPTVHAASPEEGLGAKLGAILRGPHRTRVDDGGLGSPSLRRSWTIVDSRGHGLEIYGSEGWGFESLRACCRSRWDKRFWLAATGRPSDFGEPSVV